MLATLVQVVSSGFNWVTAYLYYRKVHSDILCRYFSRSSLRWIMGFFTTAVTILSHMPRIVF